MKYSFLVFGEGGGDKKFLIKLIDLDKFKFHTKNWVPNYGNASGGSPRNILEQCKGAVSGRAYDLVLCFIDLDKLKSDFPKQWQKEKDKLEQDFSEFVIIWQLDKAEDEYKRVLGELKHGKFKLNIVARKSVEKFINSELWKRIIQPIKDKELELENKRKEGKL
ncbi:MAG: hypothetical protein PHF25_08010 [Candidatus Margulisbacteria bacterium]|nr:hypothetical protein [Candidatus Margulisiibacteriota bacterium]